MKVLHEWLVEYLGDKTPSVEQIDELLTFHTFEIEGIEGNVVSTPPVGSGHTPPITGDEPGEPVLGHRGRQIVANRLLVFEKLGGHDRTDGMTPPVPGCGPTRTVTEPSGHRIDAAPDQVATENIEITHVSTISLLRGRPTDGS